jgi:2-dehydro-3-deoxyglucarate aldolase
VEQTLSAKVPGTGMIGTLVGISSPPLTEMLSTLGFDFLFLDLEHGAIDDSGLAVHIMASRVPSMVRLADSSELSVKRAADAGAHSIVVPHVRTGLMAANVVSWATYPPAGTRSVGLSRNTLLGYRLAEAMRDVSTPAVIAQIEDVDGLANIDEICSTPGLAGVFIGPFDLSASLGDPGNLDSAALAEAITAVIDAAHGRELTVGVFAPTVPAWRRFKDAGCDYVVLGADSLFIADAANRVLTEAQSL